MAVIPGLYEPGDSQPLTPYQRPPTLGKRTGNQNGVGDGGNSVDNPVTLPEGCSLKGSKRTRSAFPKEESKHHTKHGERQDPAPPTDLPRSERMLQVSIYDILQTRTYAHYRAQLDKFREASDTTEGGNGTRVQTPCPPPVSSRIQPLMAKGLQ